MGIILMKVFLMKLCFFIECTFEFVSIKKCSRNGGTLFWKLLKLERGKKGIIYNTRGII